MSKANYYWRIDYHVLRPALFQVSGRVKLKDQSSSSSGSVSSLSNKLIMDWSFSLNHLVNWCKLRNSTNWINVVLMLCCVQFSYLNMTLCLAIWSLGLLKLIAQIQFQTFLYSVSIILSRWVEIVEWLDYVWVLHHWSTLSVSRYSSRCPKIRNYVIAA